jgi:hypothetical protein
MMALCCIHKWDFAVSGICITVAKNGVLVDTWRASLLKLKNGLLLRSEFLLLTRIVNLISHVTRVQVGVVLT